MEKLGSRLSGYTDEQLRNLLEQMERLNENGFTDEKPLREFLDKAGPNGLITVSIVVYKEAATRWLHN